MIFQGVHSGILEATYYWLTTDGSDNINGLQNDGLPYTLASSAIVGFCEHLLPFLDDLLKAFPSLGAIQVTINIGGTEIGLALSEVIELVKGICADPDSVENLPPVLSPMIAQFMIGILETAPLPPLIDLKAGTFGFFKGSNGTKTWWTINSGLHSMDQYNRVMKFNGGSSLPTPWWKDFGPTPSADESGIGGICHEIIGTDGLAFPPKLDENTKLWLFNDQLCRSIWLTHEKDVSIDGLKTLQFSPPADVFSFSNPDNYCYCPTVRDCAVPVPENDTWDLSACNQCIDGLLPLQGCQGAPVLMSTPHFLDGDPKLAEAIDGISPVREAHKTILNLEPHTGMPLQAHKRIQISVPLRQDPALTCLSTATPNVFPLVWVDEGADITPDLLKEAKGLLVTPFLAVDIGSGVMIGVGGIIIIALIVVPCIMGKKKH